MVSYTNLGCPACQAEFGLTQGEVGWVDEKGNFGLIFHVTNQPVGKPIGKWKSVSVQQQLCTGCGEVIFVIQGEVIKSPKMMQFGQKPNEILTTLYLKTPSTPKQCPKCQGNLVEADKGINQTCPKCKSGKLILKQNVII